MYAISIRHTTDQNGKRGSFRTLLRNDQNLNTLGIVAKQIGLVGKPGTCETAAERMFRLYSFIILDTKQRVVKEAFVPGQGVDWKKVRRNCGSR